MLKVCFVFVLCWIRVLLVMLIIGFYDCVMFYYWFKMDGCV